MSDDLGASMPSDTPKRAGRPRSDLPTEYRPDAIRDAIIARVEELGYDRRYRGDIMTISAKCGGSPGYDAIKRYLERRACLNTAYVSTLADALGMGLMVVRRVEGKS